MVKDETVVTCFIGSALTVIAVGCLATGTNGGLVQTIVAALAAFVGVGLGRATKTESKTE